MSEHVLRKFSLKEEFLQQFLKKCCARPECVFSRPRVKYDYTKREEIDAVLLTSQKVILLEIVTLAGKYKIDKDKWIKEEVVEDDKQTSQTVKIENGTSSLANDDGGVVTKVTIISTSIPNPVLEAKRKTLALKQYVESKIGPRNASDFDYRVVIGNEQCTVGGEPGENRNSKIVTFQDIDSYTTSLRIGWTWWFLEKVVPMWPIWIGGYTQLKNTLSDMPTLDVLVLKSGSKLYGELCKCPGVPYDTTTTAELTFKESKTGYMFGSVVIDVQGIRRGTGSKIFTSPCQLQPSAQVEFLCVEADSNTLVKVTDIVKVLISLRDE